MILLASPARAGCSLDDVGKAFYGTLNATLDCKSVCESEEACDAAVALDLALAGVALEGSDTGQGQALVDKFCKEAQGTADQIVGTLNTVFGNAIAQEVLGDLSTQLSSVGSAAKVVKCSCETEQSTKSLGSGVGECMQEALCGLGIDFGCACTRPPAQTAQCPSIDVKKCTEDHNYSGIWNPACIPSGSIANCNPNWQQCGYAGYGTSVAKAETPEGTLAIRMPPTAEGTGCNEGVESCFCPAGMNATWHEVPNPNSGDHRYIFSCDCPYDAKNPDHQTHPGPLMPSGISSCLCNNTNQPANFGLAPFGMCPPPACPAGQTRMGGVGDCVTPCSDPSQGMAFDGSCCNPAQMTSCGECCPPSTVPDPKSGTCVPRPQQPK
jgi:hypothetical protein